MSSRGGTASFYYFADDGDLTVKASVWGAVRFPGRYEVRTATTLAELFSLAGGPSTGPYSERQTPVYHLSVSRVDEAGLRSLIVDVKSDEMTNLLRELQVQEGDVLMVEIVIEEEFDWLRIIPVLSVITSLALLIERISSR